MTTPAPTCTVLTLTSLKIDGDQHDAQQKAVAVTRALRKLVSWKISATDRGSELELVVAGDALPVWEVLHAAFPHAFRGYRIG